MKFKPILANEPKLTMSFNQYAMLMAAINKTNMELTFICHVERAEDIKTNFYVKNIYFPPQWNEIAESKTIDSQYPKWCFDLVKTGVKLNGHGHTHPNASVTPSGYDVTFFEQITKDTTTFQLRLIANKKGQIRCDVIDKELNYIAEEINVYVTSKHLTLLVNVNSIAVHFKSNVMSIFATLDTYKDIAMQSHIGVDFEETRRCNTDEKITYTAQKPLTYRGYTGEYVTRSDYLLGDEEDGF